MIHPREPNIFPLFDNFVNSDITGKKILDFGGNRGNLIHFSNGIILEEDYTSLDVSKDALSEGKLEFPNATWIWYDRYNSMYNTTGSINAEFPILKNNFDYIWSFSVVTHTDLSELVKILRWMKNFDNVKVMVSFLDKTSKENLEFFYNKRVQKYGSCIDIRNYGNKNDIEYFYLIDSNQVVINTETYMPIASNEFLTFYDINFLKNYLINKDIICDIKMPKDSNFPFVIF